MTPTASSGNVTNLFRDDTTWLQFNSGTSPGTIVIEIDATAIPITVKSNNTFALGVTYRSDSGYATATHVKIEIQSASTSYQTVFDADVNRTNPHGQWISPTFFATSAANGIKKLQVTLTVPSPLIANLRLQRIMLYHGAATYDPWHLHLLGGTVFGPVRIGAGTASSQFQVDGPIATAISSKTAAYTVAASDSVILCDASSAAFTLTLPTAVGISGRQYTIKRLNSGSNDVTIDGNGTQTIDGSTTLVLTTQYETAHIVSDGANWWRM